MELSYFAIIIGAIFVNNVVLAQFLGICPFLGVSSKVETSMGMGAAVTFVMAIAAVVDWLLRYGAGALGWDWPVEFLFASIVIIWLVINELLSILENVSAMGAPVPEWLMKYIAALKNKIDSSRENVGSET